MSVCTVCDTPVTRRSKTGLCRICAARKVGASNRKPERLCVDCGVQISRASRGRCRPCSAAYVNADPGIKLRRAEGIRRKFREPEHREKMRLVAIRNGQKAAADPEHRAWLVQNGKKLAKILHSPECRRLNQSPEVRAKAGRKISEYWLGWCPEEFRARYRYLVRSKRMLAADAREIIEKMVADDKALPHIDSALEWLRRLAPVQKLENGYRYGNAILSPSEVIDRAKLRGWEPERWAA